MRYLLNIEREQNIQKENLVAPDDALLLRLLLQPFGPLVGDITNLQHTHITKRPEQTHMDT